MYFSAPWNHQHHTHSTRESWVTRVSTSLFVRTFYRLTVIAGSGYVRAVGSAVKVAKPGDAVLLSYNYCGTCTLCSESHFSYCEEFNDRNFGGRKTFKSSSTGTSIPGSFFGQSSFAHYSIVHERSVVNVADLVSDKKELALFSPLGCGIQTGAGTVINAAQATSKDAITVSGLGGVGLSAIMAAKLQGCRIIVGIDRVESRLSLAKELGATHVVDSSTLPEGKSLADAVRDICDGKGPTIIVETTGAPFLIKAGLDYLRPRGLMCQIGTAPFGFDLEFNCFGFMVAGKTYRGVIEGESRPWEFVPKMIRWYREGRFPVDKLVKFLPVEEFQRGLHEMVSLLSFSFSRIMLWGLTR